MAYCYHKECLNSVTSSTSRFLHKVYFSTLFLISHTYSILLHCFPISLFLSCMLSLISSFLHTPPPGNLEGVLWMPWAPAYIHTHIIINIVESDPCHNTEVSLCTPLPFCFICSPQQSSDILFSLDRRN